MPNSEGPLSPEALARLRADLVRAVSQVCPSWLRDSADDLVQTALIRLVEKLEREPNASGFSWSYLRTTACNAMIDEIRRRRSRHEEPEDQAMDIPAPLPSPYDHVVSREIARAVRDCLKGLVESRRRALTLYLQGHRSADLARRLGWDKKQAENLVYRGRADLRDCLKARGITI